MYGRFLLKGSANVYSSLLSECSMALSLMLTWPRRFYDRTPNNWDMDIGYQFSIYQVQCLPSAFILIIYVITDIIIYHYIAYVVYLSLGLLAHCAWHAGAGGPLLWHTSQRTIHGY